VAERRAGDLLVLVADELVDVGCAVDALELELGAVGDRAAGVVAGARSVADLLAGVERGLVLGAGVDRDADAVAVDRGRPGPQRRSLSSQFLYAERSSDWPSQLPPSRSST
jgi:hypothetical protein